MTEAVITLRHCARTSKNNYHEIESGDNSFFIMKGISAKIFPSL